MQIINITGNLAADAQEKSREYTDAQGRRMVSEYVTFTVLVNNKRGETIKTTNYDVYMNKTNLTQYLKKGQKVVICGNLDLDLRQSDKDGKTYLNATISYPHHIELAGYRKQDEGEN
jgi:single-stranded DNA-binding protein